MKILADALAFISAAFLAFPAWYINRYAHLVARVTLTRIRLPDPQLAQAHRDLLRELRARRDDWTPRNAWCLHIGTVAGLLATLLAVASSIHERLAPAIPAGR